MCLDQVGAWGSVTRTSGTSSTVGAHSSSAGTMGSAGGCGQASCEELFPVGSLLGADGRTATGLPKSNWDTEG